MFGFFLVYKNLSIWTSHTAARKVLGAPPGEALANAGWVFLFHNNEKKSFCPVSWYDDFVSYI
jgi:hypothetical protein